MSQAAVMDTPPRLVPGKKYRFMVKSAEEAVRVIQERMGPQAKVLAVNQVGGQGLSRFLQSPKLEIIATIPVPEAPPEAPAMPEEPEEPTPDTGTYNRRGKEERVSAPPPPPPPETYEEPGKPIKLAGLLTKMGFERALFASLEGSQRWRELEKLPLREALVEYIAVLRDEHARLPLSAVSTRIAFLGTPGSGKTTALCKQLAQEVFIEQRQPRVMRLDGEVPNSNDALATFCEALGVPLGREPRSLEEFDDGATLYFDMPGVPFHDPGAWEEVRQRLDRLQVGTRVLVVNAAYQVDLIKDLLNEGLRFGATHVVFTHLDEVRFPARLWHPLLRGNLSPWFVTHSPSVTDALRTDIFTALLERTFPKELFK